MANARSNVNAICGLWINEEWVTKKHHVVYHISNYLTSSKEETYCRTEFQHSFRVAKGLASEALFGGGNY